MTELTQSVVFTELTIMCEFQQIFEWWSFANVCWKEDQEYHKKSNYL